MNKDRNLLRGQSTEVKLELFALFQQANVGDAKPKDFDRVPEEQRDWVLQKQQAWEAKRGMLHKDAKQAYMDLAAQL